MAGMDELRKEIKKALGPNVEVIDMTPAVDSGVDTSECARRQAVAEINAKEEGREELEKEYGQVWNTEELSRDFEVEGFLAPYVVVRRKSDRVRGTLTFQHRPRFYWGFTEDR